MCLLTNKAHSAQSGISSASVTKLGKEDNITTDVLLRMRTALEFDIADIMEVIEDDTDKVQVLDDN